MNEESNFLIDMGNRIAKRRKECHLTQEQLAEKINLSIQSISCIELGKKAIRPHNLVKLCNVLDVSADYILTGKRSESQLSGICCKLAALKDDDLAVMEGLIDHLSKK